MEPDTIDFVKLLSPQAAKSYTKEETLTFLAKIMQPLLQQPMNAVFHHEAVEVSIELLHKNMVDHLGNISFHDIIQALLDYKQDLFLESVSPKYSIPVQQKKVTSSFTKKETGKKTKAHISPEPQKTIPASTPAVTKILVPEKEVVGRKRKPGKFDYNKALTLMCDFIMKQNKKKEYPSSKNIKLYLAENELVLNPSSWQALRKKFPYVNKAGKSLELKEVSGKGVSTTWQIIIN